MIAATPVASIGCICNASCANQIKRNICFSYGTQTRLERSMHPMLERINITERKCVIGVATSDWPQALITLKC